jgi:hypothetical protein
MKYRSPGGSIWRHSPKDVKAILEQATSTKDSGLDFSKVTVVSRHYQINSGILDSEEYELCGIFDRAANYIVYYGAGCLATENFPAKRSCMHPWRASRTFKSNKITYMHIDITEGHVQEAHT